MSYQSIIKNLDLKDMKLRRMDVCIKVMQRAIDRDAAFYINDWQCGSGEVRTEKGLHKCGSAACFAGWLAVSPEFKRAGGGIGSFGIPEFNGLRADNAVNEYLGLEGNEFGHHITGLDSLYDDSANPVTAKHVLARLKYAKQIAIKQKAQS